MMVNYANFHPACYLPTAISNALPSAIACPPPPSYFSSVYNAVSTPFTSTYGTIRGMLSTLVGLPFISILLIPTTGSYSTTLNLFFFYITWSTLILSHPPLRVEFISSLVVRLLFYVFPSLIFLSFDTLLPSTARSFKSKKSKKSRSKALPALRTNRSQAPKYLRILGFSILNVLLSTALQVLLEITFTRVLGVRSALRVVTAPPSPFSIVKHIAIGYLLRDILTYSIHRYILHEDDNLLSRLHNEWYHAIDTIFPLSATYDHPLPYLLHRFLPMYLPAMLFRFHLLTYIIYSTLISFEETWAYSGYSSGMNFVLGGIATRTEEHLTHEEEGNFGTLGLVDWVMGTSLGGNLVNDVGDEAEERDVRGKTERMGEKGAEGLKKAGKELMDSKVTRRKGGKGSGS